MLGLYNDQRAIAKLLPEATNIHGYFEKKGAYVIMHMLFQLPIHCLKELNELMSQGYVVTYKKHGVMQKYIDVNVSMKLDRKDLVSGISMHLGEEMGKIGKICELKLA